MNQIESTLTNFKNKEAISLLDEIALPSILLSAVKQNNIEFFNELLTYEKKYNSDLFSKKNDEGQNVFHMIGQNSNSEHMMNLTTKSNL